MGRYDVPRRPAMQRGQGQRDTLPVGSNRTIIASFVHRQIVRRTVFRVLGTILKTGDPPRS